MQPQVKNILVIRSATRILNSTLQLLKQEFPESRITVMAFASVKASLLQDPRVDEVFELTHNGRLTLFNLGVKNIQRLRMKNFDLAVSLYNIDHGLGYSNVDFIAAAVGAREIRGYNPREKYITHTPSGIFKKSLLEKTAFFWIAINYLVTGVLFGCIALGLTVEWCVRKLFGLPETFGKKSFAGVKCLAPSPTDSNAKVN